MPVWPCMGLSYGDRGVAEAGCINCWVSPTSKLIDCACGPHNLGLDPERAHVVAAVYVSSVLKRALSSCITGLSCSVVSESATSQQRVTSDAMVARHGGSGVATVAEVAVPWTPLWCRCGVKHGGSNV